MKFGDKFCFCHAREYNEVLDDVLALFDGAGTTTPLTNKE